MPTTCADVDSVRVRGADPLCRPFWPVCCASPQKYLRKKRLLLVESDVEMWNWNTSCDGLGRAPGSGNHVNPHIPVWQLARDVQVVRRSRSQATVQ